MRILAVGDSITRARGVAVGGVQTRSWAAWVADALQGEATLLAEPGLDSGDVLSDLVPRIRSHYDLGLVYVGVNDVLRRLEWDVARFEANLAAIAAGVAEHAPHIVFATIAPNLGALPTLWPYGRNRSQRIDSANEVIRRIAAPHPVAKVPPLRPGVEVFGDMIHPTSLGQIVIARAALEALQVEYSNDRDWDPLTARYLGFYSRYVLKGVGRRAVADPATWWRCRRRLEESDVDPA